MVAAESTFEMPEVDEIYLVSQRKYNLDPSRPLWQKLYFRVLFLPFVRFSFRHAGVPAIGAMDADGSLVIIEQQRVCVTREAAQKACVGEFWSWKALPLDTALPAESVQYKGHHNPLSAIPDCYRRRTFPVAIAPTHAIAQVKANLQKVIHSAAASQ